MVSVQQAAVRLLLLSLAWNAIGGESKPSLSRSRRQTSNIELVKALGYRSDDAARIWQQSTTGRGARQPSRRQRISATLSNARNRRLSGAKAVGLSQRHSLQEVDQPYVPFDPSIKPEQLSTTVPQVNASDSGLRRIWDGIDNLANREAGLEPRFPLDMGVAASDRFVVQVINTVAAVFTVKGSQFVTLLNLPGMVGLDASRGDRMSDPRVLFDVSARRWVITAAWLNRLEGSRFGHVVVFVSQSSDPTQDWVFFKLDGSGVRLLEDGSIGDWVYALDGFADCREICYPDFPTLGHDKYGLFISATLFSGATDFAVASTIWAASKNLLYANQPGSTGSNATVIPNPSIEYISYWGAEYEGLDLYTIQPAILEQGSDGDTSNGGTQWLAAHAPLGDGIVLIALIETSEIETTRSLYSNSRTAFVPFTNTQWIAPSGNVTNMENTPLSISFFSLEQVSFASGMLYMAITTQAFGSPTLSNPSVYSFQNYGVLSMVLKPTFLPPPPNPPRRPAPPQRPSPPTEEGGASKRRALRSVIDLSQGWSAPAPAPAFGSQVYEPEGTRGGIQVQVYHEGITTIPGLDLMFPVIAANPAGQGVMMMSAFDRNLEPGGVPYSRPGLLYVGISPFGTTKKAYWLERPVTGLNASSGRWGDYLAAQYSQDSRHVFLAGMTCRNATRQFPVGRYDNVVSVLARVSPGLLWSKYPPTPGTVVNMAV